MFRNKAPPFFVIFEWQESVWSSLLLEPYNSEGRFVINDMGLFDQLWAIYMGSRFNWIEIRKHCEEIYPAHRIRNENIIE